MWCFYNSYTMKLLLYAEQFLKKTKCTPYTTNTVVNENIILCNGILIHLHKCSWRALPLLFCDSIKFACGTSHQRWIAEPAARTQTKVWGRPEMIMWVFLLSVLFISRIAVYFNFQSKLKVTRTLYKEKAFFIEFHVFSNYILLWWWCTSF